MEKPAYLSFDGRTTMTLAAGVAAALLFLAGCTAMPPATTGSVAAVPASTPMAAEETGAMTETAPMTESAAMTESAGMTESAAMTESTEMTASTDMTASTGMTGTQAMGATALNVADNAEYGKILVDGAGMTLYQFDKDTRGDKSTCYGDCEKAWPPLLTAAGATPTLGAEIDAGLVGTTTRDDGTTMVTYNGWPLYYYYTDAAAGDTTGQGKGDVWWVISPAGEPNHTK